MIDTTQDTTMDMPVGLTVSPAGRLTVVTAQGHVWQWQSKERRWEMFVPVPFTAAAAQLEALLAKGRATTSEAPEAA